MQYSINNGISYQSSNIFSGLPATTLQIKVMDANNCSQSATVIITAPLPVTVTSVIKTNPLCDGLNTGSITINATGGASSYSYSINSGISFQLSNSFSNLPVNTYNIVVSDTNGCTASDSATITSPSPIQINSTASTPASCGGINNGSLTINASGGTGALQYSSNKIIKCSSRLISCSIVDGILKWCSSTVCSNHY